MKFIAFALTCFVTLSACTAAVPPPEKSVDNKPTEDTYATEKQALLKQYFGHNYAATAP